MTESANSIRLQVRNVTKRFPGVVALKEVHFDLMPGEVLALIGENGAGKSTLMKILAGVQQPDSGQILLDGQPVAINSVQQAQEFGLSLIHQELNLSDNLDVGANIFLGREPTRFGMIDRRKINEDATKYLNMIGLDISPTTIVNRLTIGQQQMVEIARALSTNARVLIMDEPTSSLSSRETEALFEVVKDLRSKGVSIIYISHRLGEVIELANRVTVLRDGENAGDLAAEEINHDAMVKLMVGRDLSQFYSRVPHEAGPTALQVKNLVVPDNPKHTLSFSVQEGEIVGIAGLVGAGRSEMLQVLFGVNPALSGSIQVGDRVANVRTPYDAINLGMALVPEDRKQQGLILEMSIQQNIGLAGLRENQQMGGWLNQQAERDATQLMMKKMRIKAPSAQHITVTLSGGNQQKVVLGKWLSMGPKVLLLDEPTRGIDIGAKHEIYSLMDELAKSGVAILFASSEMEEILGMSDRAIVMHEGKITGELLRKELSEESVMHLATGGNSTAKSA